MFICLECGKLFDNPKHYVEKHGLDTPPYEHFNGCPNCSGSYDDAVTCDKCGETVPEETTVVIDGDTVCEECLKGVKNDE